MNQNIFTCKFDQNVLLTLKVISISFKFESLKLCHILKTYRYFLTILQDWPMKHTILIVYILYG